MAARGDRIALLADAAIEIVAEGGMRGLTHRAVDARAGVPLGTTSAYLRTRRALVEAVVRRVADLDRADLAANQLPDGPEPPVDPTPLSTADLDHLATGIAATLDAWLSTGRQRTLARYACLLEANHHPELRRILAHGDASRAQARALLGRMGHPRPDRAGVWFVSFVDGLLFDRLIGAGARTAPPPGTPEHRADLRDAIRTLLHAMAEPVN
ncbi:TetR/AcrR family transcriptional regulator [Plantactinospora sp. GCM10030261]|uniref:TetR/AcrR family transcriptional regulator n=1 Tax=Plantactinospora sp. GCM10030261 TaxID=3273420 RepID=UPI003615AD17